MKKNVGKKFRLMALLTSLTLVLWGGVIACSNGSDDDPPSIDEDKATEVTKTISFDDEEKAILETSDTLENMASIKITVTGITGTISGNWWFWAKTDDDKGDDIKWKTGEGEACIYEIIIEDATKIAYIKENGLAIKGASGLTAKVTVIITKSESTDDSTTGGDTTGGSTTDGDTTSGSTTGGTTTGGSTTGGDTTGGTTTGTGEDATGNTGNTDGEDDNNTEAVEFSYTYKAGNISEKATSITITVTEITSTTDNAWEFWAITNASDKDEIKWKSGEGAAAIYELTISDATKIAYLKEKGIEIKGAKGLTATVNITTSESGTTPPDEGDDDGEDGNENGNDGTKTVSFTGGEQVLLEASKISETVASSIKITVTNVTGTASSWWFWAKTDGDKGDDITWKSGSGETCIYELTITDDTKIAYIKEKGLVIKGAAGLTADVTAICD